MPWWESGGSMWKSFDIIRFYIHAFNWSTIGIPFSMFLFEGHPWGLELAGGKAVVEPQVGRAWVRLEHWATGNADVMMWCTWLKLRLSHLLHHCTTSFAMQEQLLPEASLEGFKRRAELARISAHSMSLDPFLHDIRGLQECGCRGYAAPCSPFCFLGWTVHEWQCSIRIDTAQDDVELPATFRFRFARALTFQTCPVPAIFQNGINSIS